MSLVPWCPGNASTVDIAVPSNVTAVVAFINDDALLGCAFADIVENVPNVAILIKRTIDVFISILKMLNGYL